MKAEHIYILHPENEEQESIIKILMKALKIKFEVSKEKPYNPEFVEKIERSKKQHLEGKDIVIKTEDLWK
jgi:hypothetical protein